MQAKKFQRTVEDFNCGHCGFEIFGDGYTNHCPRCLWSRHVDKNPGDRAASCGGMMEPMSAEEKNGEYIIMNRCIKCGLKKNNKSSPDDNIERIIDLSAQHA